MQLFSASEKEKEAFPFLQQGGYIRGYLGQGSESGSLDVTEQKEGFSFGSESSGNLWPRCNELEHRKNLVAYHALMCELEQEVLNLLFECLGIDKSKLNSLTEHSVDSSILRLFHYTKSQRGNLGSALHTHWGLLTLVHSPDPSVKGLQIFHQNEWIDIQPSTTIWDISCKY